MILPFSTQLNGKPTYFVERIQTALRLSYFKDSVAFSPEHVPPNINFYVKSKIKPKIHTIREDKKNRWKVGTKIDFFINVRQKNMFRFAPVLPVVSTQKVEFIWKRNISNIRYLDKEFDRYCTIKIDDKFFGDALLNKGEIISSSYNLITLANNDGFDTEADFFAYFNKDYVGKIIHWTDKRY